MAKAHDQMTIFHNSVMGSDECAMWDDSFVYLIGKDLRGASIVELFWSGSCNFGSL